VSGSTATTRFPLPSSFAISNAAWAIAPDEMPTRIPSSFASFRAASTACSKVTSKTRSTTVAS